MATCKACGAEEDLAAPLIDGTCPECLRKQNPQLRAEDRERQARDRIAEAHRKATQFKAKQDRSISNSVELANRAGEMRNSLWAGLHLIFGTCIWFYYWFMYDPTVSDSDGDRIFHVGRQQQQMLGFLFGMFIVLLGHLTLLLRKRR